MLRRAPILALLAFAGCSLLFPVDGQPQPCDSSGQCLPGYACAGGVCTASPGSSGGDGGGGGPSSGCSSDVQCPAGGCAGGACSALLVAWGDGGSAAPSMACYPWPPPTSAGDAPVRLGGCIVAFPGDQLGAPGDAGGVQVFEDGVALGPPVALAAAAECPSGVGYQTTVPPGQLLDLVVSGPQWTQAHDQDVRVPADGGQRELGAIGINRWSTEVAALQAALGLTGQAGVGLVLGRVRDCAGLPLSGVQVLGTAADGGALSVAYLDAEGAPAPGRQATSSSGRFAAIALEQGYQLSFEALPQEGAPPVTFASLPLTVGALGTTFVDVAPDGP